MLTLELNEKTYSIPENADDLTLQRFDQIRIYNEGRTVSGETLPITYKDVVSIVSFATGIEQEQLLDSPSKFFDMIFEKVKWVFELNLDNFPLSEFVEIQGEKYSYEKNDDCQNREWVDMDAIIQDFPEHDKFVGILCIKLRKVNKDGKGKLIEGIEKYDTQMIYDRKDLFNTLPVSKVIPIINFFLSKEKILSNNLQLYSTTLGLAYHNHQTLIEWQSNGDGFTQLAHWRKKIFLNWMKFLTSELDKHLHFYLTLSKKEQPKMRILN